MSKYFTLRDGEELSVELYHKPSCAMDHKDFLTSETDGKLRVGYLVDDSDCENPLEDQDGNGHIYTSRRHDREGNREMQKALGLNDDWEPNYDLVDEDEVVELLMVLIASDVDAYATALQFCQDNYPMDADESAPEFVRRIMTCEDDFDRAGFDQEIAHIYEDLYDKGLTAGTIGDKHVVSLDVYEHSGVSYSISGSGMQCRFDTAKGGAVWVPDDCAREEIICRGLVYIKGKILNHALLRGDGPKYCVRTFREEVVYDDTVHPRFENWIGAYEYLKGLDASTLTYLQTQMEAEHDAAIELAKCACEEYTSWSNGDCYGWCIETFDINTGEQLDEDSCWGYIGSDYAYSTLEEEFKNG